MATHPDNTRMARYERALARCERAAARLLRLERGCNVGPLAHVALYYVALTALVLPGVIASQALRGAVWVTLLLLNYSLTIGVLHMHAHRPLFTSRWANRALDLLLCGPSLLTATEMAVFHVGQHHRYENGPDDPSTTLGSERGWRAVRYWVLFGVWVKTVTLRLVFGSGARPAHRAYRSRFALELAVGTAGVAAITAFSPFAALSCWYLPQAITHVTAGYFAWLTHAPAGAPVTPDGSINTVNNLLGFFVFNQGYHQVHHAHPGIHWSEIPDHLDGLLDIDSRYIVSYWVTLNTAWRVLVPRRFHESARGDEWKRRYQERRRTGTVRLCWLRHFAWI